MINRILNRSHFSCFLVGVLLTLPCCKDSKRDPDDPARSHGRKPVTSNTPNFQKNVRDRELGGGPPGQTKNQSHGLPPRAGGLLSSYKSGGIELMQKKIDSMGPGLNRRQAIDHLLSDASNLDGGLNSSEFTEIFRFIDQLPYEDDKGGFGNLLLHSIIESQSEDMVANLIASLSTASLRGSLSSSLGKTQADAKNDDVRPILNLLPDSTKPIFLSAWADRIEKNVDLSGFDDILKNMALAEADEDTVIDSYVQSLTSKSGPALVASSKTLENSKLAQDVLIAGYKRWLREDSMAASSDLVENSNKISPQSYDIIAQSIVMKMQNHGDLESAAQWSETINDLDLRTRMQLFLKQAAIETHD